MRRVVLHPVVAALLLWSGACARPTALDQPSRPTRPRLIVQIVVDQMRSDYIPRYGAQWTAGLHRLLAEGAHFVNAAYPYAGTVTCAGHASIGTGTVPSIHGMVRNEWWDRDDERRIPCPDDRRVTPIGFTKASDAGYSGRRMMADTFAMRLDASQPADAGRVVTLSLKARSAIGLAGKSGDAVVWFDSAGTFATSSAFGNPAWLDAYLEAHPVEAQRNAEWTRMRDAPAYLGSDHDGGARPPSGWTSLFPHTLSDTGRADPVFYDRWQRSRFSDAYLADLAVAAIDALTLGQGPGIDYLGVSFSALDLVGHKFGPDSHEVQDILLGVDAAIGRLLAHLDTAVGSGNYVVALTSDHGVSEIPEDTGGARIARGAATKIIEDVLDTAWGADTYVAVEITSDVYLTSAARARLQSDAHTQAALRTALEALPGVDRVLLTPGDVERAADSSDPIMHMVRMSYYPDRAGDVWLLLHPNAVAWSDAASHGTPHAYDRRVPVILFGSPFKAGTFEGPASPLDIAPTWSRLTGVALDRPYGRSLDAAVK